MDPKADPLIYEICKARGEIRSSVFSRWQRELRGRIQPALDELAALKAKIASGELVPADPHERTGKATEKTTRSRTKGTPVIHSAHPAPAETVPATPGDAPCTDTASTV